MVSSTEQLRALSLTASRGADYHTCSSLIQPCSEEFSSVSRPTVRHASSERSDILLTSNRLPRSNQLVMTSLAHHALLGLAASALLGLVEWVDLNIQLTPVFESAPDRLVMATYLTLNLL